MELQKMAATRTTDAPAHAHNPACCCFSHSAPSCVFCCCFFGFFIYSQLVVFVSLLFVMGARTCVTFFQCSPRKHVARFGSTAALRPLRAAQQKGGGGGDVWVWARVMDCTLVIRARPEGAAMTCRENRNDKPQVPPRLVPSVTLFSLSFSRSLFVCRTEHRYVPASGTAAQKSPVVQTRLCKLKVVAVRHPPSEQDLSTNIFFPMVERRQRAVWIKQDNGASEIAQIWKHSHRPRMCVCALSLSSFFFFFFLTFTFFAAETNLAHILCVAHCPLFVLSL